MAEIVLDDKNLRVLLRKLDKKLKRKSLLLKTVAEHAQRAIRENFRREEDSKGRKWKPRSDKKIFITKTQGMKSYRQLMSGKPLLNKTGELQRQLRFERLKSAVRIRPSTSRKEIGAAHQFGAKRVGRFPLFATGKGRNLRAGPVKNAKKKPYEIPKREWLYIRKKDQKKLASVMTQILRKGL